MTPEQLEMLLDYISNEIALSAVRATGQPWESFLLERNMLQEKLRASVLQSSLSYKGN